jgi:hypothetical protein
MKPGEDRFSVSKFWVFQHVYQKSPLDIMSDIIIKIVLAGCRFSVVAERCGRTIYWDSACHGKQPEFFSIFHA